MTKPWSATPLQTCHGARRVSRVLVLALTLLCFVNPVAHGQPADVVVAIPAPLTGPQARTGAAIQTAAGLVAAEINMSGGINGAKLVLALHDDPCTTGSVPAIIRRIAESVAVAVIGHACAPSALAAAPNYAAAEKLFIAAGVPIATATAKRASDMTFRIPAAKLSQAAFIGQTLAAVPGARIAIVRDKTRLTIGLANAIHAHLRAVNIVPAALEIYAGGDKDFSALAQRLATAKISHVALIAFSVEGALVVNDLTAKVPNIAVVGSDLLATADFAQLAGPASMNVRVVVEASTAHYAATYPTAKVLIDRLINVGLTPTRSALATAAALEAWAAAARRAGSVAGRDVAAALTQDTETVMGLVRFGPDGAASQDVWRLTRWQDGELLP